jgi:general secretion pathway protein D
MSRARAAQTPARNGSHPSPGRPWLTGVMIGLALCCSVAGHAADKSVSTIAENEVRRREALVNEAGARLVEADALLKAGKSEEAVNAYSQIYQSLPKAAMAVAMRDHARAGFAAASCNRARELMAEARYAEAMQLLDNVLSPDVDPDHEMARKLRKQFQDPDRYPTALTPQHIAKVKEVERLLELANSALEIGDYDKSIKVYEDVIRLDPYNKNARRGMERAEQKRTEYFDSARDHTRAQMLAAIDKEWEQQVPPSADMSALFAAGNGTLTNARSGRDAILEKLRSMIVPKVDFSGATLEEVIEYIRVRSRDLDPKGRGVDFVMNVPAESSGKLVSLYLEQVPLEDVLRYVTEKAGASYRVEDRAVTIISLTENSTQLIPKTYRVPPNFIQTSVVGDQAAGAAAPADPFAQQPAGGGPGLVVRRMGAREFLESRGVTFKEGASAAYVPSANSLFVRNTPDNLAIVDMLVEQASASSPKQVLVSVKLMEVNQTNFDEIRTNLGLGAANVPGSDRVFGSGGASAPGTFTLPNVNSTTAGLRPSGDILGRPSIDSLLTNAQNVPTLDSASPAAFQLLGAFTDPQFQVLATAISQKKGTDLVSVPSVIMKSGVKTEIEMVREFPYPTEFDPPEIPQNFDPNGTIATSALSGTTQQRSGTAPITPTTPTAFEVRKVGSLLEVEAVVSEDGRQVELTLAPSTTEFEGFIDYGTDITNSSFFSTFDPILFAFRNSSVEYVVDNPILQPVFRTNKLSTGVLVWDGSTVVLGGVLSEKRTQINDKVPFLGDIPFLGKLWQNKVTQVERKNVLFFVTVKVIDAAGQPIRPVATAQAR